MAESRFVYVTYIRTTPQKLWQALIDPEFTRRYWVETWQESDWKPGASWRMMIPDGRVGDTRRSSRNRARAQARADLAQRVQARAARGRLFAHDLRARTAGRMVKLTLIHEIDKPGSKLIDAVSNGWPMLLSSLKSLLETGEPLEASTRWPKGV